MWSYETLRHHRRADIHNYDRVRSYLRPEDFCIYCDSGLYHQERLCAHPDLIVGDFDSHPRPESTAETIVLPTVKDDTDTVFAVKEALRRGFEDFCWWAFPAGAWTTHW